jgi:hypothetical protein
MKKSKLKLIPLLFLILLSRQVNAGLFTTWEHDMTEWAGLWKNVHSTDQAVKEKAEKRMEALEGIFMLELPNDNKIRTSRFKKHLEKVLTASYPNITDKDYKETVSLSMGYHNYVRVYALLPVETWLLKGESKIIYELDAIVLEVKAKIKAEEAAAEIERRIQPF